LADELSVLKTCDEVIRSGNPAGAVLALKKAIKITPGDWRLHDALGDALSSVGREEEAIGSYLAAAKLNPDLAALCVKIGRAFFSRGLISPALFWLRQAMQIDATCESGMPLLATVEAKGGNRQSVADLLSRWIAINPGDPVRRHLATAILGEATPERPEDGYVSILFDKYAPYYDRSLAKLHNSGPQLIVDALVALDFEPQGVWNIIDAGCGTGLAGELVKPFARRIIGVDLSQKMLQQAASRGIYDELIHADMVAFARSRPEQFELIVAADALTYCGELGAFFQASAERLTSGGLLVFTLEALLDGAPHANYRLNPSGRYAHHEDYVCRNLASNHLNIRYRGRESMRHELGRPVPTLLFAAEKSSEP
jgi:predicted TPR repeat methyltransferase